MEPIGLIPLADGGHVVVDAADVPFLSLLYWHRHRSPSNPRSDYARAHVPGGGSVKLHRLLLLLVEPKQKVDHRNGCGLDCRRSNLRRATSTQNAGNQRARRGRAQYKGVSFRRNSPGHPWAAYVGGRRAGCYLGSFSTPEEAALAYDLAALARWGEFAHTNLLRP